MSTKPSKAPTNKYSESLLTDCDKAYELTDGTLEDLVEVTTHNAEALGNCRRKHSGLVNQIRKVEASKKDGTDG